MTTGTRSRGEILFILATVIVCPVVALAAVTGGTLPTIGVIGLIGLAVAAYVGLRHPLWLYWSLAVAIGLLPFGTLPGVPVPLYLLFSAAVVLAAVLHPSHRRRLHLLESLILLLVLVSGLSMVFTALSLGDYIEYIKWSIVTLLVIALLRLSTANLRRFGQVFVCATAFNGAFGLAILAAGGTPIIKVFSLFGYGAVATTTSYVYNAEGQTQSVRFGGMWVEPNAAGIGLLVAMFVGIVVFDGWRRLALSALFMGCIVLTLSRSALFSVVVGLLLAMLFHRMSSRTRPIFIGGFLLAIVGAAAVPQVRNRILQAFVSDDVSSSSRTDALKEFPHQLSGHWLFGLGWDRPEFKTGSTAFTLNHVANAPLLTVYRGGLFTGAVFLAILLLGCVIGWRALGSKSLPRALFGGTFIGFFLIALQLDHPVVAVLPVTTAFSIFLTFVVYIDRERMATDRPEPPLGPPTGAVGKVARVGPDPAPAAAD
ncbi:O-antigen ligase family protein [Williamsia phyllosphaerae]|uniref:O-antigen ligase-related domain-containing protein n=1 Tax=Williamsia phyllosphaerae TaxID=885042 RepID=A0ABQ1UYQ4_9NOCA|nr:O-antigen ligase family protein [Williamsia phyllosphaerae]GGF28610.1 hypothetical protein GCM10007298_25530 [Williamsia phyllosphaerae]